MSAPRQDVLSRMIVNLEGAGFKMGFTSIYWVYASGFPKAGNVSKMVDKREGVERDRVSVGDGHLSHSIVDGRYGKKGWVKQVDEPVTDKAKEFHGSYTGFQPKPAVEIIIVCMKPLSEKTYVDQALKNRKGITWLDDARIPYQSDNDKWKEKKGTTAPNENIYGKYGNTMLKPNNNAFIIYLSFSTI